jgi:hypothetical protein
MRTVVEGSTISTDDLTSYRDLGRAYVHVRDIHHVNTLESHWSLFQRAVKRNSRTHLSQSTPWKYISEFSYRRNHASLTLGDV